MEFDKITHKVVAESLNKEEAKIFLLFLKAEQVRHQDDIDDIQQVIDRVGDKFGIQ